MKNVSVLEQFLAYIIFSNFSILFISRNKIEEVCVHYFNTVWGLSFVKVSFDGAVYNFVVDPLAWYKAF